MGPAPALLPDTGVAGTKLLLPKDVPLAPPAVLFDEGMAGPPLPATRPGRPHVAVLPGVPAGPVPSEGSLPVSNLGANDEGGVPIEAAFVVVVPVIAFVGGVEDTNPGREPDGRLPEGDRADMIRFRQTEGRY